MSIFCRQLVNVSKLNFNAYFYNMEKLYCFSEVFVEKTCLEAREKKVQSFILTNKDENISVKRSK